MANLSKIRDICNERGMSLNVLSYKLGMTSHGLQRILRTNTTKIDTLEKIAEILNVPVTIFFQHDKKFSSVQLSDFYSNNIVKISLNRYDKISDKLSFMKDVFVWEVVMKIKNGYIPSYPFVIPGKPKSLLNTADEINFFSQLTFDLTETPFSKLHIDLQKHLLSYNTLFEGFYFPIFYLNMFRLNYYLNDQLIKDKEVIKYWRIWKKIDNKIDGVNWIF